MTFMALFLSDFRVALMSLQVLDFLPAVLWMLWIAILVLKLKGIDGRDDVTKLSYIAVVAAIGCLLLIALPTMWGSVRTPLESVLLAGFFVVAAHVRWIIGSAGNLAQTVSSRAKVADKIK